MRILAVDFGLKNIGLAFSEGFLVEPMGTAKDEYQIQRICEKHQIEKIIIGLSEGKMADKTKAFGEKLKKISGLPVEYQDETLTSEKAKRLMVEIGKPKNKRQKQSHTIAAALILQSYLREIKS